MLLQELVEQDFGIEGRGKWYHSTDHDSLVVNAEDQTWFWNSRGLRGNIFDYLVQIRGMNKEQAKDFLKNYVGGLSDFKENQQVTPYDKLVDAFWINGLDNREYWYKRCINDDTIDRYRLGYYNEWFTIPIYDNLELVNFQLRRDEPEKKIIQWYRTGKVFLYNESILQFTKTIYITEGLVDCILLNQEGFTSVAATGVNTWQQDWFYKFINMKEIYYLEDNDTAGRIGSKNVAKCLGLDRVKIVTFPGQKEKYDTGDFFKDGGTKESFKEYVLENSHYLYELENIDVRKRQSDRVPTKYYSNGKQW